jgi:hypothetical protein
MSEYVHNKIFLQIDKEQLLPAETIMYWSNMYELVIGFTFDYTSALCCYSI